MQFILVHQVRKSTTTLTYQWENIVEADLKANIFQMFEVPAPSLGLRGVVESCKRVLFSFSHHHSIANKSHYECTAQSIYLGK